MTAPDSFTEKVQHALGGTYRIERELGGGGMSRVYVATEPRVGRQVVVKVLPPEMSAAVNRDRFEREIQLAGRLQHPHIVPVLTVGGDAELLYYVMPFIEGESLRARLAREGALPIPDAVRLLREVADALAEAHRHGIVHRDIKPDNILLRARHAMVADFGVAKAVAEGGQGHTLTSVGMALGTPAYMAPEQATADPLTDHRADLYSLGCVAYEMLAGRPPFDAATPQALIAAHVTQAPEPLGRYREVPPALGAAVMRLLAKRPPDRFQTAEELVQLLDGYTTPAGTTPMDTAPYPAADISRARAHGHPLRVAGYFALASLAVLALVSLAARGIGLPTWVFPVAATLLAVGLPIMIATGLQERRRRVAQATGMHRVTPAGLAAHLTWRKAILGGGLAFGALALAAGGYVLARNLGIGPVGTLMATGQLDAQDRMVLADFVNLTPDSTISASITSALRVDLSQSPVIRLLDESEVREALQRMQLDPATPLGVELANTVAIRENAKVVIAGEIAPLGTGYVLTARIMAAADGRDLLRVRETAASADQIISALDAISKKLRERVGESLKSLQSTDPLDQVTTASLPALRKYTEAVRLDDSGEHLAAYRGLQEAVRLDSTFAMAWRKMSVVADRALQPQAAVTAAAERAFALRDRLPEQEALLTTASYFTTTRPNADSAIRAYRSVLALDPRNRTASVNLPMLLLFEGRVDEAEAAARHALTFDRSWFTYHRFAMVHAARGDAAATDSVLQEYHQANPENPLGAWLLADAAGGRQEFRRADSLYRAMTAIDQGVETQVRALWGRSDLAAGQGQLRRFATLNDSVATLLEIQGVPTARVESAIGQLYTRATVGQPAPRAIAVLGSLADSGGRAGSQFSPQLYYQAANAAASAGEVDLARRLLAEGLRRAGGPGVALGWRLAAEANTALAAGDTAAALGLARDFRAAPYIARGCTGCADRLEARALDLAGQPDSALALYDRSIAATGIGDNSLSPVDRVPMLMRSGELHEARGNRDRARDRYQAVVDTWREADPELQPRVEEARQRLARLSGEQ